MLQPYIESATALSDIFTNIQACMRQYKFHHLTYLKEAHFTCQLPANLLCQGEDSATI